MNDSSDNEGLGKALSYSARAPLMWRVVDDVATADFDADNELSLRTILNLSEYHSADVAEEFAALERKVDITLEMVASLLRAATDMPEAKEFRLGAHELSWQQADALPELGTQLNIIIYLHELYSKPITLAGRVKSTTAKECVVERAAQSSEVQQLLENFIFLHHRRAIAQSKHI